MKKITAIILATLACVMILSSCALVTPKPLDLADKYDKAGYTVSITVDNENIVEFLENAFDIDPDEPELVLAFADVDQIVNVVSTASKNPPSGFFVYYSDANSAKKDAEAIESYISAEENEEAFDGLVVYRQGKLVFFGMSDCWYEIFK